VKTKQINFFEKVSEYINLLDDDELSALQKKITALLGERQVRPISQKALQQAREDDALTPLTRRAVQKYRASQEAVMEAIKRRDQDKP